MFGSNFKWVEKKSHNFFCLTCCEIKLFFQKELMEKISKNKSYFLCLVATLNELKKKIP